MADTSIKLVHSRTAATPPDPIQLHAQAMNSLSRCQRELRAEEPCYGAARAHLDLAQQAMTALEVIETGSRH